MNLQNVVCPAATIDPSFQTSHSHKWTTPRPRQHWYLFIYFAIYMMFTSNLKYIFTPVNQHGDEIIHNQISKLITIAKWGREQVATLFPWAFRKRYIVQSSFISYCLSFLRPGTRVSQHPYTVSKSISWHHCFVIHLKLKSAKNWR